MIRATVIGASGYIGGELLRLLLGHPYVDVAQATSDTYAGRALWQVHPNLKGFTNLRFSRHDDLTESDVIFIATPHGQAHSSIKKLVGLGRVIIDLSADFRLPTPRAFKEIYGIEHASPEYLDRFIPGIPERYRDAIETADLLSVPGCTANASILALLPLVLNDMIDDRVSIETKAGSSGSGATHQAATHHPERSGVVRVFKPVGHRHEAEVERHCGVFATISACSVEMVRGVHVTAFARLKSTLSATDIRDAFRSTYRDSPFVRLTHGSGRHGLPEPKLLSGTNYCDVGFAMSNRDNSLVTFSALDNLMKGGAGNAVQCMNIRFRWPEQSGLDFPGLYPL